MHDVRKSRSGSEEEEGLRMRSETRSVEGGSRPFEVELRRKKTDPHYEQLSFVRYQ